MTQALPNADRLAFCFYRSWSRLYFHMPILIPFLNGHVNGYLRAQAVLACYAAAIAAASFMRFGPRTSHLLGLKCTLTLAEVLKAAGLALLIAPSLELVLLGQAIGGCGFAMGIGTDSILLRSWFSETQTEEYKAVERRSMGWVFPSVLASGVIGSWLYVVSSWLPFIAAIVASLSAAVAISTFGTSGSVSSSASDSASDEAPDSNGNNWTVVHQDTKQSPRAPWSLIRSYVVIRAIVLACFLGLFPVLLMQVKDLGIGWFGLVLAAFSVAASCAAGAAGWLESRLGSRGLKALLATSTAGSLALLLWQPASGSTLPSVAPLVASLALLGLVAGTVRPFVLSHVNRRASQAVRHRRISIMESGYGLANAALLLMIGSFTEFGNADGAILLMIVLCLLLLIAEAPRRDPRADDSSVAPSPI